MSDPILDPAAVPLPPITDDPEVRPIVAELGAVQERISKSERGERIARARIRGQKPTASVQDRAKALMAGGTISATRPEDQLSASLEEQEILGKAAAELRVRMSQAVGEVSLRDCKTFEPLNRDGLRMVLDGLRMIHQGLLIGTVIRSRLIGSGRQVLDGGLSVHTFPMAAALGSPDVSGTPAALFRQWLEQRGIV